MREIKFRAWDDVLKYWLNEDDMPICGDGKSMYHKFQDTDNIYFSQYTGLKDRNGVEIFEGDIVKFKIVAEFNEGAIGEFVGSVDWDSSDTGFFFNSNNGKWPHIKTFFAYDLEVIGNIYENPELLK
jgi:uncharacterized phage protein (TIGR01671 family)